MIFSKLFLNPKKKIKYLVIFSIILLLLVGSINSFLTSLLNKHNSELQEFASNLIGTRVNIGKVEFSWYRLHPDIALSQIQILNKNSNIPLLQIQKINVALSFWKSLFYRSLTIYGISISGSHIKVQKSADQVFAVQGFVVYPSQNISPQNEPDFKTILGPLSKFHFLELENIKIDFLDEKKYKQFFLDYLAIDNSSDHYTLNIKLHLLDPHPAIIKSKIIFWGDITNINTLKAKIYLNTRGIILGNLLNDSFANWKINGGLLNAKIWANWNANKFDQVKTSLSLDNLELYIKTNNSHHTLQHLSGDIEFLQKENNLQISGNQMLIEFSKHVWPTTNFSLTLEKKDENFIPRNFNIEYLNLNDFQELFLAFFNASLSNDFLKTLSSLNLNGELQNLALSFSSKNNFSLSNLNDFTLHTNFSHLSFSSWNKYPGMENLHGELNWNGSQGQINLNTNQFTLNYDAVFSRSLFLDQVTGNIFFQQQNNNWDITLSNLQILNKDLAANFQGLVKISPQQQSPWVDLKTNFTMQNAKKISNYLPLQIFDPSLRTWLQKAFLSGEVKSAQGVLKGFIKDFPFDSNNGIFAITGMVKNVNLFYASDWPILRHIEGLLTFNNRKMFAEIKHAQIDTVDVNNIKGIIPYLGDAQPVLLQIDNINTSSDFNKLINFIDNTPLKQSIGSIFSDMKITGPLSLKLNLTIPVKEPNKTIVKGLINFKESIVNFPSWHLVVTKLKGILSFSEKDLTGKNIEGVIFNKPLRLNIDTNNQKEEHQTKITFNTFINIPDLEKWLKVSFSKIVTGSTEVNGQIFVATNKPFSLQINSMLKGLSINLPEQYSKKKYEQRASKIVLLLDPLKNIQVKLLYSNLLSASASLQKKDDTFDIIGAILHLGEGEADFPSHTGLYVSGNFDDLDAEKIFTLEEKANIPSFPNLGLKGIDIKARTLRLFAQVLTEVHIIADNARNAWKVDVSSQEINGQLQLPLQFSRDKTINAKFKNFNLQNTDNKNTKAYKFDIKNFPSINFQADDVQYNTMDIGKVTFKTIPTVNGLKIPLFIVSSPFIYIESTMTWVQNKQGDATTFVGTAQATALSSFLSSLGLDAHNFISKKAQAKFNLTWNSAPYNLSLANLDGTASLEIGPGRIIDIGQEGGAKMDLARMLSIFSLQTIPRRLSLDFSDVFQKGYSFDFIKGDFQFQDGDAYTNNLQFDGPVAKIGIDGRIGLKDKDYNLTLVVVPHVTSSIPVAATLITGNPLIGLAALGVNTVINAGVNKVTTYYYQVRGPWNNPTWSTSTKNK